jgi:hypothetical protein
MWGPIIEKGWAKVKGSYMNADGGISANALRFMTGAPVQDLKWTQFGDKPMDGVYKLLKQAFAKGYLVNTGTDGDDDQD